LFLVFHFNFGLAEAQEEGGRYIDEPLQMGLADHFFQEGDFPRSARAEEALWKIARSYFQGKKWDEAISSANELMKRFPSSRWRPEALLLKGRCWSEKGEYSQARYFFHQAREAVPRSPVAQEAQWQMALTYLKEEKWKEAAREFRKIEKGNELYAKAEIFAQGLDNIQEVPQKSPIAAGVLAALLPGAGHLYCERYRDAAIAFVLNGAFIWGMVEAFEHENYVVGGILTFFELGWYSGNIYSAVSSAHKYNRRKKKEYLDTLEKEGKVSWGISFQGKNPVISLTYVF